MLIYTRSLRCCCRTQPSDFQLDSRATPLTTASTGCLCWFLVLLEWNLNVLASTLCALWRLSRTTWKMFGGEQQNTSEKDKRDFIKLRLSRVYNIASWIFVVQSSELLVSSSFSCFILRSRDVDKRILMKLTCTTFWSQTVFSFSFQLKCLAAIHEIYRQSEERLIEEIRPKILATGTSSMNMYHSVLDGESLTDPNVGMTQYKGNYFSRVNQKLISTFARPSCRSFIQLPSCCTVHVWLQFLHTLICTATAAALQSTFFLHFSSWWKI